jgi:hypothetical protein
VFDHPGYFEPPASHRRHDFTTGFIKIEMFIIDFINSGWVWLQDSFAGNSSVEECGEIGNPYTFECGIALLTASAAWAFLFTSRISAQISFSRPRSQIECTMATFHWLFLVLI